VNEFERATGWGLGRTATERDWRCHWPVAQTPACLRSGYRKTFWVFVV